MISIYTNMNNKFFKTKKVCFKETPEIQKYVITEEEIEMKKEIFNKTLDNMRNKRILSNILYKKFPTKEEYYKDRRMIIKNCSFEKTICYDLYIDSEKDIHVSYKIYLDDKNINDEKIRVKIYYNKLKKKNIFIIKDYNDVFEAEYYAKKYIIQKVKELFNDLEIY